MLSMWNAKLGRMKPITGSTPVESTTTFKRSPDWSSKQRRVEKKLGPRKMFVTETCELIQRILDAQKEGEYEAVLDLPELKELSDRQVKKAERRMVLKVHSDRTDAPRADDAFNA